ncbi:MAG: hypothetical protein ACRCSF_10625 [Mycobacteriaceae bacterium]
MKLMAGKKDALEIFFEFQLQYIAVFIGLIHLSQTHAISDQKFLVGMAFIVWAMPSTFWKIRKLRSKKTFQPSLAREVPDEQSLADYKNIENTQGKVDAIKALRRAYPQLSLIGANAILQGEALTDESAFAGAPESKKSLLVDWIFGVIFYAILIFHFTIDQGWLERVGLIILLVFLPLPFIRLYYILKKE